jgi:SpoIID/LytB domain protein
MNSVQKKRFLLALFLLLLTPNIASADVLPPHFVLTGSGFGHGVGMSQIGAKGQALEGKTATDILSYWFPGTQLTAVPIDQNIKVNVAHAVTFAKFTFKPLDSSAAWNLGAQSIPVNSTVRFSLVGKVISAVIATPKQVNQVLAATNIWNISFSGLLAMNTSSASMNLHYGSISLRVVGSKIEVTDTMLIDQYVLGVSEISSSWPSSALQAQAIASRTYGLAHLTLRPECDCNVYSSKYDQVYVGYAKESELGFGQFWSSAVAATEADPNNAYAITYLGRPITVYFFSSDGGMTQTSQDVWGTAQPYLTNVADPWSLDIFLNPIYAHWQRILIQKDVATAFKLPDVLSLTIATRSASNAATTITATSSTGTISTLQVGDFKTKLKIPSSWFEIAPPGI